MPGSSQTSNDKSSRSDKYYYETVVFEVEGTLYRVLKQGFTKWSHSVFRDMFSLPQGSGNSSAREGETDEDPIKLVGCTKAEFEGLLELMNPSDGPGVPELSKKQWVGALKLGRLWDMPKAAALAIEKLSALNLRPVEKVHLGRTYGVATWLKNGYETLVGDHSEQTGFEEMTALGYETISRILWARGRVFSETFFSTSYVNVTRYLVDESELNCGACWKNRQRFIPVSPGSGECSFCRTNYSYGATSIAEMVGEVFKEELKEAKRRNATITL